MKTTFTSDELRVIHYGLTLVMAQPIKGEISQGVYNDAEQIKKQVEQLIHAKDKVKHGYPLKPIVTTKDEAREAAIDWWAWAAEEHLSYGELAFWQDFFMELAERFNLIAEFRENGVI